MDQRNSERQLLLALLAFQTNFIDRPQLLLAFDVWSQDKSRNIASLLVEQHAIKDDERQLLEGLAARHIARFDNDVQKSLGHVSAVNSSIREELQKIASPDLQASLKMVGQDADPYATVAHAVGESTSDGTRFKILRRHARGALGEVFVAEDGELPREVALKQIQSRHADDADSRARFVQEAEITGGLEHPNIVPVYGLGTYADGRPFYAMRFIRGDSLQDAVKRLHESSTSSSSERTLQFRKLLQRFIDVCNAIAYAHSRGVLHRDLKPGNIMLGKYGETVVVDWGLAKVVGRHGNKVSASEERTLRPSGGSGAVETAYGAAIGTPAYMSPEQAAGRLHDIGPAGDVYSLGATLYDLLTGQPPFKASDLGELLRNVQQGTFPPPRTVRRDVPQPLEAICLKAMSLQPANRYATARALADDLEHWLADEPTAAHRETLGERIARWSRKHRTAVTVFTATTVIALIVGLVAVRAEQRETERQRETAELARVREADQRHLADQRQIEVEAANATSARSNYFLADARWKAGLVAEAREQLESVPLEHRLLEWRLARREYEGSAVTLFGHTGEVASVTFSPDGARLASASDDKTIKLWDLHTGAEVRTIAGHTSSVRMVTFSPDGMRLATASADHKIKLWDAQTGAEICTLTGHGETVTSVAFSPDGARLASASGDKTIRLWDAQTGAKLRTLDGHTDPVTSVTFSPDGRRLASSSIDDTIKLWDARTGAELRNLAGHTSNVLSVTFSPDGAQLASASWDNKIKLWDAQTGAELRILTGHASAITSVAFSPDGVRIASASDDRSIKLWDAQSGAELRTLIGHAGDVVSVTFSPDGALLASASEDLTIKLWDARAGSDYRTFTGHSDAVASVTFNLDGTRLASAGKDKTIKLWDAQSGAELRTLAGHSDAVAGVAFSHDGARLASAGWDKTIKLWDLQTGLELRTLKGHARDVTSVTFSPDGSRLASASVDRTIKLWDAQSGAELRTLSGHLGTVASVTFCPHGVRLASAGGDKTIKVWDAQTGAELRTLTGHSGPVASVTFSHDGSRLASACWDNSIKLWDAQTGAELRTLTGHSDPVTSVTFSHDDARLVSASDDKTIKLWDAQSGAELRTLTGHSGAVTSVTFSHDGTRLASASRDRTINLRDVNAGAELRTLTGHAEKVSSVKFSSDGARLFSESSAGNRIAWNAESAKPLELPPEWPNFNSSTDKSPDGRWLAVLNHRHVLLVDLHFRGTPDQKAYRQFKAKLDPWWHTEQARTADLNTPISPVEPAEPDAAPFIQQTRDNKPQPDWYAAAFHWAWVVKAYLEKPEKAAELNEARERLPFCVAKWRQEFARRKKEAAQFAEKTAKPDKPPTPVSDNSDDYLAPIVREMLAK